MTSVGRQTGHDPGTGQRHQDHGALDAGLEADGSARGDVEPLTVRGRPVELQRGVGLGEVEVRTDLHGPVAGVAHRELGPRRPGQGLDDARSGEDLARDDAGGDPVTPAHGL